MFEQFIYIYHYSVLFNTAYFTSREI